MKTTSTIHSPMAIAGGITAALGATALLVRDAAVTGVTIEHILMPVMVCLTILAGHKFWDAVREFRAFSAFGLAVLAVTGSCLIVYETMGRRAEIRDTKVAAAQAANFAIEEKKAELVQAQSRLADANVMIRREMTGERCLGNCKDWKTRASEVEAKVEKLTAEISGLGGEKPVDAKADRVAAVASILSPETSSDRVKATVATLEPFALPLFLELGSIICFGYGIGRKRYEPEQSIPAPMKWDVPSASDTLQTSYPLIHTTGFPDIGQVSGSFPEPPKQKRNKRKEKKEVTIAAIRAHTLKHGAPPSFKLVRSRYKLSTGTASRWRTEGIKQAV